MRYLVTGASGFLGRELISRLDGDIVAVSRNEGALVKLKTTFPQVEIIPGDISSPIICSRLVGHFDAIFHLAAFKHVTLAEKNVYQCVQSNVIGTLNVLAVPSEYFVFISTDKAAQVNGVYGATKFLGEKLVMEYSKSNYRIIRYGNVFGSTGSFIHIWRDRIDKGLDVIITDPEATRFFFPVAKAVDLILSSLSKDSQTLIIPKIKSVSMGTALSACKKLWGECKVKMIGLQQGENKHETMDGITFSNQVEQYTEDEFIKEFLL